MAPPRTQKRKSGPQTYESDDGFVANDSDHSDRPTKRSKTLKSDTKSSHFASAGQSQLDTDGNEYWEISKMRRITISEFKGKRMVNIREYYEKDGKDLPGKKGISMPVEQYSALVDLMPQIEKALQKKGEKISRPDYGDTATGETAEDQEEQPRQEEREEEADVEADKVESKAKNGKRKKANIEATSDEDEDD